MSIFHVHDWRALNASTFCKSFCKKYLRAKSNRQNNLPEDSAHNPLQMSNLRPNPQGGYMPAKGCELPQNRDLQLAINPHKGSSRAEGLKTAGASVPAFLRPIDRSAIGNWADSGAVPFKRL